MAEYFNYCIANERTLAEALSGLDRDFKIPDYLYPAIKWLEDSINQNIFAQAWLYGYEVEEEPKFVVKQKDGFYIEGLTNIEGKTYAKTFDSEAEAYKWAELCSGMIEKV